MSLASKIHSGIRAARHVSAVALGTGGIPRGHRCMVLVEPTSVCNLACPLCPTGTGTLERENKFIPMSVFDRILDVTAPLAEGYILNLFGEPTFHPQFGELLQKTAHRSTWLSTNLSYSEDAVREMARWPHLRVICSIDTVIPEEYPRYRVGGDWDKVMRNLEILAKGSCEVHPQFLVPADHRDDEPLIEFARRFAIAPGQLIIKRKMENFRLDYTNEPIEGCCHSPYMGIFFDCDGHLLPCCNNARKDLHMLHIDEITSHLDILGHKRVMAFRKQLARDKNAYPSCGNCAGISFWKHQMPLYLTAARSLLLRGRSRKDTPGRMAF